MLFKRYKSKKTENEAHLILEKYLPYYRKLNSTYKRYFRQRVFDFANSKEFRGGNNTSVSFEQIVAISGAAIQLSFGNSNYSFSNFHEIIIYPEMYKSSITGQYHRGEVNPNGIIVISWKDFVYGYSTDEDNLNVALHEMGHAYFFSIMMNRYDDESDVYDILSKFVYISEVEIIKIRRRKHNLFRKYAGANIFEFFAISMEHFFENSIEFKKELPGLYRYLCLLLNQDPAEEKPIGFNYKEYFKEKNLRTNSPIGERILFDDKKLGLRNRTPENTRIIGFIIILAFIMIMIYVSESGFEPLSVFFALSLGLLIYAVTTFVSKDISISENYLIIKSSSFIKPKSYFAIHFDNIVAAEIEDEGKLINLRYLDEKKISDLSLSARSIIKFKEFRKKLIEKDVMLKIGGQRIARIRTKS